MIFDVPRKGFFCAMFTGIIKHIGKFVSKKDPFLTFQADESICKKLALGSSIAINGVCLTVYKPPFKKSFSVTVMPETIKRTMLGNLHKNDLVNLELPMTQADFFAGHIVQGHVDGTGIVTDILPEGNSKLLKITLSPDLSKYIVDKGSIAVNGISLTVIQEKSVYFTVGIIPYTWKNTMLKDIKIGDAVNIETDIIAKYLEKFIKKCD